MVYMYGWRARIGLIVPSSNTTMEEEFRRVLPEGVSLHTSRIRLREVTRSELVEMEKGLDKAVYELSDADVDIIVFGCTTGSLIGGYGYDQKLSKRIEELSGKSATTTSTAVINAFRKLNVRKLSVATPYIDDLNNDEKHFFEDNGFEVIDIKGLGLKNNLDIGEQPPTVSYRLAKTLNISNAECVFISCTNFRTFEVIKPLEMDLGMPVVSSNQATLWYTLKRIGIQYKNDSLGRLFSI